MENLAQHILFYQGLKGEHRTVGHRFREPFLICTQIDGISCTSTNLLKLVSIAIHFASFAVDAAERPKTQYASKYGTPGH